MDSSNILNIIDRLVNSEHFDAQINKKDLKKILKDDEIESSLAKQIILENCINPSNCRECGGHNVRTKMIKTNFLISCQECSGNYSEPISNFIYYKTSISKISDEIFKFLNLTPTNIEEKEYYMCGTIEWENNNFSFLFFPKKINIDDVLAVFYKISKIGGYVLCIVRDLNLEEILELYSFITFGKEIKIIPLSMLDKQVIVEWLNFSSEIIELENMVISEFNQKLKELIVKINENPQYALTLLTNLKVKKQIKKKGFEWQLYENIIAIIFNQLYPSDISIGGGRNKGSAIQDGVFIVNNREEQPIIFGAIECKSSLLADLSYEPTEKYINYLNKMQKYGNLPSVRYALIFVFFDYKSSKLIKFYERIEKELGHNQYLVILPINTIIVLTEIYFNIILRGEFKKKEKDNTFSDLLINIFDDIFLKQLKIDHPKDYEAIIGREKLYQLNYDHLFEIIKSRLKSSGSLQEFFFNKYKSE